MNSVFVDDGYEATVRTEASSVDHGDARPQGLGWDIGFDEVPE